MIFSGINQSYRNDVTINGGAVIDGTNISLTNSETGRIVGGLTFAQGGHTVINELGGIIRVANGQNEYGERAITGSAGDDTLINRGLIAGLIRMGDGRDRYVRTGENTSSYHDVDMGEGDDRYETTGVQGYLAGNGGGGRDLISITLDNQATVYGSGLTGFEDLAINGTTQLVGFSGFQTISLGTPHQYGASLIDSFNPIVDLMLSGNSMRLYNSSLRSVTGSDAAETFEVGQGSTVSGRVSLGGGDDRFAMWGYAGQAAPVIPAGGVNGGAGSDTVSIRVGAGQTFSFDFATLEGFERLSIDGDYMAVTTVSIANALQFSDVQITSSIDVAFAALSAPSANVHGAFGGSISLDGTSRIARYGFPTDGFYDQRVDLQQADDRLSTRLINAGAIGGEVRFYIGDDRYDGSAGSVGGPVYGNAGNDELIGGAGAERFEGGYGADTLSGGGGADALFGDAGRDQLNGGAGADLLTGGEGRDSFRGTRAELAGDRIADFEAGESITILDADLGSFSYGRAGDELDFGNGQRLTLNGFGGALKAQAAPGGGVTLTASAVSGDLNGDGRADILWRNDDGALTNWLGRSNGGFAGNEAVGRINGISTSWKIAGFADLNGDGRSDILWRNSDGSLTNWLGRADGGYAANDAIARANVSTGWKVAGLGDFNGDGRSDILWRNDSGAMTNWLSRADGGFTANDAAALDYGISTSWKVAGVGDFNGDGRSDILWRNDNGAMTNWLGQASGGFVANNAAALNYGIPTSWRVAGVADFNGDGRSDILWRNDNGALTDWLGQANGGFVANDAAALIYTIPTSWKVAGVADFNGDGRSDILWRNDNGAMTNWLGDTNGAFAANDAVALDYSVPRSWHTQLQSFDVV